MSTNTDVVINEKIKVTNKEPKRYKVIMLNDDKTPMDFVVSLLIEFFKHSEQSANNITVQIHEEGSGVVGIYSYEIAEQKAIEATTLSRDNGFPLRLKVEEDA
jgi:ATP-dependent Clp protease adaptor protein ClpS